MDIGTQEVALLFSGLVCVVGLLNFRATSRERELARIESEHQRQLDTREWRTDTRATLNSMIGDIRTVKTEQREMRGEVRDNAERIRDLKARHDSDVQELSGRIETIRDDVGDLMEVMKGDAEQEMEDKQ